MLTTRRDGDARPLSLGGDGSGEQLHESVCGDRPWNFVHQVHGRGVVSVSGAPVEPVDADALVTELSDTPLSVLGADCALVGLASEEGVLGAAHAGWRGLVEGVIGETVREMRAHGATRIDAVLSACVHPECYPFSARELDDAALVLGDEVRAVTANGQSALDLPAAVRISLARSGVEVAFDVGTCTSCGDDFYSHRARGDSARQALVIWRDGDGG